MFLLGSINLEIIPLKCILLETKGVAGVNPASSSDSLFSEMLFFLRSWVGHPNCTLQENYYSMYLIHCIMLHSDQLPVQLGAALIIFMEISFLAILRHALLPSASTHPYFLCILRV